MTPDPWIKAGHLERHRVHLFWMTGWYRCQRAQSSHCHFTAKLTLRVNYIWSTMSLILIMSKSNDRFLFLIPSVFADLLCCTVFPRVYVYAWKMLCVPTERPAACLSHGSHSCQHVNLHDHQNSSSHSNIFISASDCYSSHWFLQAGQVSYCQGVILVRPPSHG